MMNFAKKYIIAGVLVLVLAGSFHNRVEASTTLPEIKAQLSLISLMLGNLGVYLKDGSVSPEYAKLEIQRISGLLSSLTKEANLATQPTSGQGYVLGASTSQNQVFYPERGREAIVMIEPSGGNNIVRTYIDSSYSSTILSFKVKSLQSEAEIRRIDISFNKRIWLYADEITLSGGGKTLVKLIPQQSDFTETSKDEYTIRFGGFSEIVKKGNTEFFYVKIKPKPGRSSKGELFNARVFLNNGAVRLVDSANFQHTLPVMHGGWNGSFSREFEIIYL